VFIVLFRCFLFHPFPPAKTRSVFVPCFSAVSHACISVARFFLGSSVAIVVM